MKSAMQEWTEWLKAYEYELPLELQIKAKELLEKEKDQLIKAHIDGFDHIVVDFKKQEFAEEYYNQTFNQNK